jgi:TetR/AcrR family transcriptional regulator, regulator of autoinduction and epiphytic fitness
MSRDRDQHASPAKAQAILDGAMQEFLTHGYAAASMDRLAIAAKVSKPTLYSYFQNKEGLFIAAIERIAQEKLQAAFTSADLLAPTMNLHQIVDRLVETIASEPQLLDIVRLVIGESGRFPELGRSFVASIDKPIIQILSQYLGARSTVADSEAGARVIMGAVVYSIVVRDILCGQDVLPMNRDRLSDTLSELFTATDRS